MEYPLPATQPLLYESHCHTPLCKHASGEPEEYAAAAERRGLKGIVITCHSPLPDGLSASVRMREDEYRTYLEMIQRAREAYAGRVDVRAGLESDYIPGLESYIEKLHAQAPLHHVLGSVHPQMNDYRRQHFRGDWVEFQQTYFEHLAMAAETGLFDTLSHPDLIKNENPSEWHPHRLADTIGRVLDRIAATGVSMELNTSGVYKNYPEMNPGRWMLGEMLKRGIPVTLGADAHVPHRVGADFDQALSLLSDLGYQTVRFYVNREPQDVSVEAALASLR
jgi:histidinol-phosphatase (PHP family)